MTECDLRKAIQEKGYAYKEEVDTVVPGDFQVIAVEGSTQRFIGFKSLLLKSSLDFFKQYNSAYNNL